MSHKWRWDLPGGLDGECPKGKPLLPEAEPPAVMPVPYERWPFAAKAIAKLAGQGDKGVGDVVQRLAGAVESLMSMLPNCGCANRHRRWNELYPVERTAAGDHDAPPDR